MTYSWIDIRTPWPLSMLRIYSHKWMALVMLLDGAFTVPRFVMSDSVSCWIVSSMNNSIVFALLSECPWSDHRTETLSTSLQEYQLSTRGQHCMDDAKTEVVVSHLSDWRILATRTERWHICDAEKSETRWQGLNQCICFFKMSVYITICQMRCTKSLDTSMSYVFCYNFENLLGSFWHTLCI